MTLDSQERLARAIEELNSQLFNVAQAIDEAKGDILHAIRNTVENPEGKSETQSANVEETDAAYCCAQPKLEWSGPQEAPGVSCANCGFPVCDQGSVTLEDRTEEKKPPQKKLFD